MRPEDYPHNTPSFPMELGKMVCPAATNHVMIKMEIKISFLNDYLYLSESKRLGSHLSISSGNDGVLWHLEHVFELNRNLHLSGNLVYSQFQNVLVF
jgi:hypothetical protein